MEYYKLYSINMTSCKKWTKSLKDKPLRLTQEETDNLTSPVSLLKVTVFIVKNPPTKKTPCIDGFTEFV